MSELKIVADAPNPRRSTSLSKQFWTLLNESSSLTAAVGYVGAASVLLLDAYLKDNPAFKLELFIGMQYIEGFNHRQIAALKKLDQTLHESKQGSLLLSTNFLHHGKQYFFHDENGQTPAAYIGSANLEAISPGYTSTYETGILLPASHAESFYDFYKNNVRILGKTVDLEEIKPKIQEQSPLENFDQVEKVDDELLDQIKTAKRTFSFNIPLKDTPKSNLNAYFGTPRVNKSTGRSLRRPWYEAEIIVPKSITTQNGYPSKLEPFRVVTDDGWNFTCSVNGQNRKNFRSHKNLSILGAWVKGRLEGQGALETGEPVTAETLSSYGRDNIDFSYIPDINIWYMDFQA